MLKILDTLSSNKKKLLPKNKVVKLFVCGPTVYDYAHIGHARTYIAFDAIVKYLRSRGFKVKYLQNITNIDDKIIKRAKEKNISPKALASFFEKSYYQDMKKLGINSADKYARATAHIPEIVKQIKTLVKKGSAYKIENDGYYFDLSAFPEYGKLAKRTVQQAEDALSRIDESSGKRNKGDFCLWKFYKKGEPSSASWRTKLGKGRPGWHIEDTAITEHYFGPQYDIHGGARDLIFPHHEAEIAQQESASGKKPFVRIWMHTGFLLVNGEKMSKSLDNFLTIRDFLKEHSPEILRMLILSHHYRSPIDYTEKTAINARNSLFTIQEFLEKMDMISKSKIKNKKLKIKLEIQKHKNMFRKAMDDDFNTPRALAVIFSLISRLQNKIWNLAPVQAEETEKFIKNKFSSLGFNFNSSFWSAGWRSKIPPKIRALAAKREKLRNHQQFIHADKLRKKIEALGYRIEDTPLGPYIKISN